MTRHLRNVVPWILLALVFLVGYGCEHMPSSLTGKTTPPEPARYSFDDILIPGELKIDEKESFVFETAGFKAGTLYYAGYVDVDSLKDFFMKQMPKDGWRLRSIFRFPKVVLVFEKPEKICIIEVLEKMVMTNVEIWVAPSL